MKILLATDGSEYSEGAARFLTRMSWTRGDAITILHVIFAIPFHEDEKFHFKTLQAIKKECAPRILDSAVAILKSIEAKISVEIVEGALNQCTPDQCIIAAADTSGADIIVLGGRGIKGIASVILGSVSRAVAINSPKPVLVVKPQTPAPSDEINVLYAADGSDHSLAAGRMLSSLPISQTARITIMNVISSNFLDIPERFVPEIGERVKDAVAGIRAKEYSLSEKNVEQARDLLGGRFKQIEALTRVGDPSAEILKQAEAMKADIIAVGCRGLRGIRGTLGSVSRNILGHAACSVLIGR
ncbi:MAG: universal stress protein [Syntrophobacteraceae bacterium]|jgi:nucleotide-binding universal stress UspA family protein